MRAALTVAHAIIWLTDMPYTKYFDMTIGEVDDPGRLDLMFQSVEIVSGQKPCRVARSTRSQSKWPFTPLPKSNRTPRLRAAVTSANRLPRRRVFCSAAAQTCA